MHPAPCHSKKKSTGESLGNAQSALEALRAMFKLKRRHSGKCTNNAGNTLSLSPSRLWNVFIKCLILKNWREKLPANRKEGEPLGKLPMECLWIRCIRPFLRHNSNWCDSTLKGTVCHQIRIAWKWYCFKGLGIKMKRLIFKKFLSEPSILILFWSSYGEAQTAFKFSIFFQTKIEADLNAFKFLYLGPEIILNYSAFFDWLFDFTHFLQSLLYLHSESCWSCSI